MPVIAGPVRAGPDCPPGWLTSHRPGWQAMRAMSSRPDNVCIGRHREYTRRSS